MVDRKPPRNHVARWMIETGRRIQENREARAVKRGHKGRRVHPRPPRPSLGRRLTQFLAWCVHTYTALGLVIAAVIAVLIVRGDAAAYQGAFALMLVATIIDATDGTMARRINIKQVLPGFDGRRLDDLTDFLNYTFLPLFLVWRAGILPQGWEGWLVFPLLASAYGFCQVSIKTDDGYFLGFPSHWNVVAFYLYILQLPGWASLAMLVALALLTFVPSKYLYPSQPGLLNRWSTILGVFWAGALVYVLCRMPELTTPGGDALVRKVAWLSLLYPVYYMIASWAVTVRLWTERRPRASH